MLRKLKICKLALIAAVSFVSFSALAQASTGYSLVIPLRTTGPGNSGSGGEGSGPGGGSGSGGENPGSGGTQNPPAQTYDDGNISLGFNNQTIPPGYTGEPYRAPLIDLVGVTDGEANPNKFNWTVVVDSGALPAGVTVNTSTGVISGTPAGAGTASVTVGYNYDGQAAEKTYTITYGGTPIKVDRLISNGFTHYMKLNGQNEWYCWGSTACITPGPGIRLATGVTEDFTKVVGDGFTACFLTTAGAVKCIGNTDNYKFGNASYTTGTGTVQSVMRTVTGMGANMIDITWGAMPCALFAAGNVKCWGTNNAGMLGDGATKASFTPITPQGWGVGKVQKLFSLGPAGICGFAGTKIQCFVISDKGQLPGSDSVTYYIPSTTGTMAGLIDTKNYGGTLCGTFSGGLFKCWGYNFLGSTGAFVGFQGDAGMVWSNYHTHTKFTNDVKDFLAGYDQSCVLTISANEVWCWGSNAQKQLTNDTTVLRSRVPVKVDLGVTGPIKQLFGYGQGFCALLEDKTIRCRGRNVAPNGVAEPNGMSVVTTAVTN